MSVAVEFNGKDRGLEAETRKQAAAAKEVDASFRDAAREMTALERSIRRGFKEAQPATEVFNDRLEKMDQLLKRDRISQQEYNTELARMKRELSETESPQQAVFGPGALASIRNIAFATGGVVAAQQLLNQALEEEIQYRKDAAAFTAAGRSGGLEQLAQLSYTAALPGETEAETQARNDAQFVELVDTAREFVARGAADDLEDAGKKVFSLTSAFGQEGLQREKDFFIELSSKGIFPDISPMTDAISQLTTNLGAVETGDSQAIVSKALGASNDQPAVAEAILSSISRSAPAAKALGLGDEDLFAAGGVLAKAAGSADVGGTQLDALLSKFAEGLEIDGTEVSFAGKTLKESVQTLDSFNLDYGELTKVLGRKEAVKGFTALNDNIGAFDAARQRVVDGERTNSVDVAIATADADPILVAAREAKIAAGRQIIDQEAEASEKGSYIDSLRSEQKRLSSPLGRVFNYFKDTEQNLGEKFNGPGYRLYTEVNETIRLGGDQETLKLLERIADRMDDLGFTDSQMREVRADLRELRTTIPPSAVSESR